MAINKKKNNEVKICPLLDRECIKERCEIYHVEFDRCMVDLLVYNMYNLSTVIKNLPNRLEQ